MNVIFKPVSSLFCYSLLSFDFISDLLNDWASTAPADIAYFVPYEWEFKFHFRDYELICLVNEHNWIDCTNDNENSKFFSFPLFVEQYHSLANQLLSLLTRLQTSVEPLIS